MTYRLAYVFLFWWKLLRLNILWFWVLNKNERVTVLKRYFYLRLTCVNNCSFVNFFKWFDNVALIHVFQRFESIHATQTAFSLFKDTDREKALSNKLLKLKQSFRNNKIVTGKNSVFCYRSILYSPFCLS